jgi:hypothetical protein
MPRGPRGETRPADVIGCAIAVAKISVGETEDDGYAAPGRRRSGLAGSQARQKATPDDRRKEIARKAASARWSKGDAAAD